MTSPPRLALLALMFAPGLATAADAPKAPAAPVLVEIKLRGTVEEGPAAIGLDGAPLSDNLKGLVDRLAKARDDKDVKGLVIRLHGVSMGMAKAHELRKAIKAFRTSGKRAYAVLEMATNADYLVAAAADEVVMPESGTLMLKGLAAEVTFYKGAFEKLGIVSDTLQVGEFKGSGEPYTRTKMSPEFRAELSGILGDQYEMIAEAIAERQGIALDDAKRLIDGGPYTPGDARKLGLINRIAYTDQLESDIAKGLGVPNVKFDAKYGKKSEAVDFSGFAGFMKMMQALSGDTAKIASSDKPKVAVIYATGTIMPGKSQGGSVLGEQTLGSDTLIKHLKEAEKDKTVKAIVLRVDSPGGSALASDLMWREIVRIEKPIVASMSDVAASGGYYISVGCDRIYAEPGTITGSIGVVGIKVAVGGLMEKLGLNVDTVTVGKNGAINSIYAPYTAAEKAVQLRLMEDVYRQFTGKVAEGRKMPREEVLKLAGGRIYTGRQAKKAGLVDELGTLDDAIVAAKGLAGLGSSDATELLILPKAQGALESLLGPLEGREALAPAVALSLLPAPARVALARVAMLAKLVTSEPTIAVMPFDLNIR